MYLSQYRHSREDVGGGIGIGWGEKWVAWDSNPELVG